MSLIFLNGKSPLYFVSLALSRDLQNKELNNDRLCNQISSTSTFLSNQFRFLTSLYSFHSNVYSLYSNVYGLNEISTKVKID